MRWVWVRNKDRKGGIGDTVVLRLEFDFFEGCFMVPSKDGDTFPTHYIEYFSRLISARSRLKSHQPLQRRRGADK